MPSAQAEEEARRAYWTQRMEEAHEFVLKMLEYPVEEGGEPMVSLTEAAAAVGVEVEFSTKPHAKGLPRIHLLREGLIAGFLAAAREMNEQGWVLKVEDAYRTMEMQKYVARQAYVFDVVLQKVLWERGGDRPSVDLMCRRMTALIAPCPKVGTHMSGSAIDISVLHRDNRREVDRGGPYLDMSERTPMDSPFVSPEAQKNRGAITDLMRRHGFVAYPWEFWHYSAGDAYAEYLNAAGQPARYGPVNLNLADGSVIPIENPTAPLNSSEEIHEQMEQAFRPH